MHCTCETRTSPEHQSTGQELEHEKQLAEMQVRLDDALAWGREEVKRGRVAAADAAMRAREEADVCYRRSHTTNPRPETLDHAPYTLG